MIEESTVRFLLDGKVGEVEILGPGSICCFEDFGKMSSSDANDDSQVKLSRPDDPQRIQRRDWNGWLRIQIKYLVQEMRVLAIRLQQIRDTRRQYRQPRPI